MKAFPAQAEAMRKARRGRGMELVYENGRVYMRRRRPMIVRALSAAWRFAVSLWRRAAAVPVRGIVAARKFWRSRKCDVRAVAWLTPCGAHAWCFATIHGPLGVGSSQAFVRKPVSSIPPRVWRRFQREGGATA